MTGPSLTMPSRHKERANFEQAEIHAILDEAMIGHLAFVDDDRPQVLPLLFVRVEDSVFLHGSTGAHFARKAAREGRLRACFEVTLVDGLVLARSAFSHSANYRSVVAHGELSIVSEEGRKDAVLRAMLDKLVPGRSGDARPPAPGELRQTAVLELSLAEAGAKIRTGGPLDDEADLDLGVWAGVLPIVCRYGELIASDVMPAGIPVPGYLEGSRGAGAGSGGLLRTGRGALTA